MRPHNRVMFVDDEEGVRLSWNRVLSERGFNVKTAVDGRAAIGELQTQPVDVVVSDLRMPVVDGIQLLEWLRQEQPQTRFILLTGYGNADVERKVRQLGAFGYLDKPIDPEALTSIVTAAAELEVAPEAVEEVFAEPLPEPEVEAATAVPEPAAKPSRLWRTLSVVGGLIAAPVMGLAFVIFLPVIGFLAFFWHVGEAVRDMIRPAHSSA
jgi:CheY-like chemotaxis protein